MAFYPTAKQQNDHQKSKLLLHEITSLLAPGFSGMCLLRICHHSGRIKTGKGSPGSLRNICQVINFSHRVKARIFPGRRRWQHYEHPRTRELKVAESSMPREGAWSFSSGRGTYIAWIIISGRDGALFQTSKTPHRATTNSRLILEKRRTCSACNAYIEEDTNVS